MNRNHKFWFVGLIGCALLLGCSDAGSNSVQPAPTISPAEYEQMEADSAASRAAAIRDSQ
ncbi:hypothetical protein [Neorhodopirellula pilleata]|uniref:hypothetical protein n=1 Tax=Neorhodopirellula pilleata TaxID=2714738 RepID=UPI0011B3E819|nr:hypothetical protein [Neorhodopirellula pilleata]